MKTTMLISCALVGALAAACSHNTTPPPQSPNPATNATNMDSTTTTAYTTPAPSEPMAQPPLDNQGPDQQTGSMATIGSGDGAYGDTNTMNNSASTTKNGNTQPAAINDPQASAKPVQPTEPGTTTHTSKAKSAIDQGQSSAEVKKSASIRRRLMASKSLSFGSKNVKIITQGTNVTLIGNVKSDAEKNEIEGIAKNTDGVTNVDDQLVVKQ